MTQVLQVLDALTSRPRDPASEPGSYSYYSKAGVCGMLAHLDREASDDSSNEPQFDAKGKRKVNAALVGKITHILLELYHGKGFGEVAITQGDGIEPETAEALRIYNSYRKRIPQWAFGRVIGTEYRLPRNDEEKALIETAVGVAPYKLIIDLVSEFDQAAVNFWYDEFQLELPGPGIYITDHKTMGRRKPDMRLYFGHDQQLMSYQLAWAALNPSDRVMGSIHNCLIRNKEIEFEPLFTPPPLLHQVTMVIQSLRLGKRNADSKTKNAWACRGEYGFCDHFKTGACDRVNDNG